MPLRVCFLSAEYAPFSKSGGLGDVASALTGYLAGAGHELRAFVPRHAQTQDAGVDWHAVDPLQGLEVQVGARVFRYDVHTARVPGTRSGCTSSTVPNCSSGRPCIRMPPTNTCAT